MTTKFDAQRFQEDLEILSGKRASSKNKAAVRIEDFTEILNLPQIQTDTLTANFTFNDLNTLLGDVKALNKALRAMASAIQVRQRG